MGQCKPLLYFSICCPTLYMHPKMTIVLFIVHLKTLVNATCGPYLNNLLIDHSLGGVTFTPTNSKKKTNQRSLMAAWNSNQLGSTYQSDHDLYKVFFVFQSQREKCANLIALSFDYFRR